MTPEEIKALQDAKTAGEAEIARLKAELETKGAPPKPEGNPDEDDLAAKAAKEAKEREKLKSDSRKMESAIGFNMGIKSFFEASKDLLPTELPALLETAEKENYDNAISKANALRASIVSEFFKIQENLDALTPSQKFLLTEFMSLTKNAREEKSESYYNNLFEPVIESNRRVRKAEQLAKAAAGITDAGGVEEAYRQRLIKKSRRVYLGEKETA
jgi:hypothetical protein